MGNNVAGGVQGNSVSGDRKQHDNGASAKAESLSRDKAVVKQSPAENGKPKRVTLEERRLNLVLDGQYKLLELIGRGGMASVYKAHDLKLDFPVAVKMLLPHIEEEEQMAERFVREAKTSARLLHPNVVKLLDFGTAPDGSAYIVMEYLDGTSLAHLLKGQRTMTAERLINIAAQICDALEDSHRKNIVHRDLKPSNVMLIKQDDVQDFVKIVDFGLAKCSVGGESQRLTATGELFGSPIYMSPEQCRGGQLDGRSDIYSLGIILYEALTGQVPLMGENVVATITKHLHEIPRPFKVARPDLYISERLEAVVMRALNKAPEHRFASMAEMKEALLSAVPGRQAAAGLRNVKRPESFRLPTFISERISLSIALFMIFMILVVCGTAAITSMVTRSTGQSTASSPSPNKNCASLKAPVTPAATKTPTTPDKPSLVPVSAPTPTSTQSTPTTNSEPVASAPAEPGPTLDAGPVHTKSTNPQVSTSKTAVKVTRIKKRPVSDGDTAFSARPKRGQHVLDASGQPYRHSHHRARGGSDDDRYRYYEERIEHRGTTRWEPRTSGSNL
jgi:serine/threonine protein kinase